MDYFQKEKAETVIDHLSNFLEKTEEEVGVRVGKNFLSKVFDTRVVQEEFDEIYDAHKRLTSGSEKVDEDAIDIIDSLLSRVYIYKMNYIYSELWQKGYAEPTAVDEFGEVVFTYTKKADEGNDSKFREVYGELRDE